MGWLKMACRMRVTVVFVEHGLWLVSARQPRQRAMVALARPRGGLAAGSIHIPGGPSRPGMRAGNLFDLEAVSLDVPGMAGTVSVVIADDLDGPPGARAMAVSFAARCYQIDLGKKNRARFRKSLQPLTKPAVGLLSAGRRELPGIPDWARPGGGACPGCGAGPERIGARPYRRRGDEQIRHRSPAAVARSLRRAIPREPAWPARRAAHAGRHPDVGGSYPSAASRNPVGGRAARR